MKRMAFKMKLLPGAKNAYIRHHEEIWPDVEALLKLAGVKEYSVFFDAESNSLIGILKINDPASMQSVRKHPIMLQWWKSLQGLMEYDEEKPRSVPLQEIFYLA